MPRWAATDPCSETMASRLPTRSMRWMVLPTRRRGLVMGWGGWLEGERDQPPGGSPGAQAMSRRWSVALVMVAPMRVGVRARRVFSTSGSSGMGEGRGGGA